jgi:lambda family phage portal protein
MCITKSAPGKCVVFHSVHLPLSACMTLMNTNRLNLVRQKIASCFAIFVQDNDADITRPTVSGSGEMKREKLEPGIIEHLPQGKTITMASPPPLTGYDEYAQSMLRKIAVGFGVSYEILSGDLSNVNFSSGRMGWIEFHRLISEWQSLMLVPMMCDPIWDWFIEAAALMGRASIGTKASWTPPRREMIDPAKEIKAMSEAVRNGFESWSNIVRQQGGDPAEVMKEITDDYTNFDKNKLMLVCDPRYDATRTNGALPDPNEDTTDAEDLTPKQAKAKKKVQNSK